MAINVASVNLDKCNSGVSEADGSMATSSERHVASEMRRRCFEDQAIAAAAAAVAVGSFRATQSRTLAAEAAEHCWSLYDQLRAPAASVAPPASSGPERYRLDSDDTVDGDALDA